jgi:hypothetical protein
MVICMAPALGRDEPWATASFAVVLLAGALALQRARAQRAASLLKPH